MEKWFMRNNPGNFNDVARAFNITDDLARLIIYRGMDTVDKIDKYLNMDITMLYDASLLDGIDKAIDIINDKISKRKPIRVVGDYDVDGIMSTFILLSALKRLGAIVDYVIPDRVRDGYGINIKIIDGACEDGIDTILTCDNGIAAISQIEHAKRLGMTVIVTDHHDIVFEEKDGKKEYILPCADVTVNPHKPGDDYPFKEICGAVVAFKLAKKLFDTANVPINESNRLIQYAALATVCDVMPLVDENRVIVREGLKMLSKTDNIGLKKLIERTGALKRPEDELLVYHLGFIIGPCLNATGRLETASLAIKLLCMEDEDEAALLASKLVELNAKRKDMTEVYTLKAFEMIDNSDMNEDKVLLVYLPDCHESIAGIIAGRVREKYAKPSIVITDAEYMCKGSGRSIEAYNMFEELTKCRMYLEKFGGHPMAAGISLKRESIEPLRKALNKNTSLTEDQMVNKIYIDIVKNPCDVTSRLVNELKLLEPCGTGNEKAVFAARNVNICKASVVGKVKKVLRLELFCSRDNHAMAGEKHTESGRNDYNMNSYISAVYFGDIAEFDKAVYEKCGEDELEGIYEGKDNNVNMNILYYPQINEYNGRCTIQAVIKGYVVL